ncbi:hypothetical protein Zm00014a_014534 [Zea mays]|uniref:Uncharacterized protein n=1 Tax=Zea mays TaxID=4577 RepID=A0A317YBD0_MAIZE|nr:hypothetical protein Zm00014a_014534 [Zea mays]
MEDLKKFYPSFWKQSSSSRSSLHSICEHKLMDLGSRRNQTQEVSTNFNKRKQFSESVELTSDVRTSVWRKSDAYHGVIDLEKPSISGDAIEAIGCSGFGNPANQNGKSQDGSCCISPENTSLAESLQSCRDWNISRVSVGSVGSSDTPDCQSPIKTSNNEARHSLFDLNVPQEESLFMSSTLVPSSSTYCGIFSDNRRETSEKEHIAGIGSMKGSSITVVTPNSVADSSRDVVTESPVQPKFLFDLNVSLENTDMPSEICDYRDKDVNNDVSKGTAPCRSFSNKDSLHAETSTKHVVLGHDHMLAHKDDSKVLLTSPTANGINKVQLTQSGTINKEFLIPGSPLVDTSFPPRLGISDNGASNIQELSMLQDKVDGDGTTADTAARTLLSIFQHSSERIAHCFGSSNQTAAQNVNDEPQPSLDSFEQTVLNLEEIQDDGQSINVAPPYIEGPACRIKLKRGRGMRNFQREIIPGLLLGRQEICEDLEVIGYAPKKARSRKPRKGPGASSAQPRPCKRGAVKR